MVRARGTGAPSALLVTRQTQRWHSGGMEGAGSGAVTGTGAGAMVAGGAGCLFDALNTPSVGGEVRRRKRSRTSFTGSDASGKQVRIQWDFESAEQANATKELLAEEWKAIKREGIPSSVDGVLQQGKHDCEKRMVCRVLFRPAPPPCFAGLLTAHPPRSRCIPSTTRRRS